MLLIPSSPVAAQVHRGSLLGAELGLAASSVVGVQGSCWLVLPAANN
jgi:hypothetical protein